MSELCQLSLKKTCTQIKYLQNFLHFFLNFSSVIGTPQSSTWVTDPKIGEKIEQNAPSNGVSHNPQPMGGYKLPNSPRPMSFTKGGVGCINIWDLVSHYLAFGLFRILIISCDILNSFSKFYTISLNFSNYVYQMHYYKSYWGRPNYK